MTIYRAVPPQSLVIHFAVAYMSLANDNQFKLDPKL